MDPRRKKIYIIIICVCLGLSVGILGWTFLSGNSFEPITPGSLVAPRVVEATGNPYQGFNPPSVFPATDVFHTDILESTDFKKLKSYQGLEIEGELGKEDLFRSY